METQAILPGLNDPNQTLISIGQASEWATEYLEKRVSTTNISYLLQYGRINKHKKNGEVLVNRSELEDYYQYSNKKQEKWKQQLGDDLNWDLSFDHLREKDTTKHVHRLHPYKGKFIPQLVEYFLDSHTDQFKKNVFFSPGDIVLDPFSGSGTTLTQAAEMDIHAIGIDISRFNCMITEVKLQKNDFVRLELAVRGIQEKLTAYECNSKLNEFEAELADRLAEFNQLNFPNPKYRNDLLTGALSEDSYGEEKEKEFLEVFRGIEKKYDISSQYLASGSFFEKWYCENIRREFDFCFSLIRGIPDPSIKKTMTIILSRTMRSCRATSHFDLATLKEPKHTTYYCWKHKKMCKPLFSMKSWFHRYAKDTIDRLLEFDSLRQPTHFAVLSNDSRNVDIQKEVKKYSKELYELLKEKKIRGIFSSPPYVGQIDYHEQHAYAYELFDFERMDDLEIGPLYKGKGKQARADYAEGIAKVLTNSSKFLVDDCDIFLVANDKHNLYPEIAEQANLQIVNQFKRPVLNRTERDRNPYAEIIFHMKRK